MLLLSIEKEDDICIVKFNGNLLAGHISEVKSKINELINQNIVKFIFDFSDVNFMDSSGIGFLVSVLKSLSQKGTKLKLCNLNNTVASTLKQVQLYSFFDIYNSTDEALESFY